MKRIARILSKFRRPAKPMVGIGSIAVKRGDENLTCAFADFDTFPFVHGDVLEVNKGSLPCHQTPDGCWSVLLAPSFHIRIPPLMEYGTFKGYKLPAHLVLLTGAGIDTLEPFGRSHVDNYVKFMGLSDSMNVMEIGCGIGRDAFELMVRYPAISQYIGIDVTRESIVWCQKNITPQFPNFTFHHFDARHELYNPLGAKTSMDFRLPAEDGSIDRIFLGSVFTHVFEEEVTHYMKEIRRVLRPDGLVYATFFLYSDAIIEAARRTQRSHNGLTFRHAHGDGCYISDAAYPTGSVAYTDEAMTRMIANGGLKLARPYLRGWWSGYYEEADDGQEVAILTPL